MLWADSLGAKSFSHLVECGGVSIVIDPGAAAMHPSYPASSEEKRALRRKALEVIGDALARAKLVVITHYHYDHYVRPWDPDYRGPEPYTEKLVYMKNPNAFINESQRERAEELLERLLEAKGCKLSDHTLPPREVEVPDYEQLYPQAARANKEERLRAGREWLRRLTAKWSAWPVIAERIECNGLHLHLLDEGVVEHGPVRVKLLGPHFHGDIYERTGWVVPLLVEACGKRILYTSDLMGPLLEDYVDELIGLKPDVVLADGPATYLPPRMYPRRNIERACRNMIRFLREASPEVVVWDHHLPREPRWREKVAIVFREAERLGVRLETVAGLVGLQTHVEQAARKRV